MLVSVIVPVYNVEKYINDCIESILNQTYINFELIIINDGSTDNSEFVLKEFAVRDNRIKLLNINNSGVSYARNFGVKKATGEFICFVDSDDIVKPDYIKDLIDSADIVINGFIIEEVLNKCTKIVIPKIDCFKVDVQEAKILDNIPLLCLSSPISKLFKKSIIIENDLEFDENINIGEDYVFVLNYLNFCKSISFRKKTNYVYFRRSNSLSTSYKKVEEEILAEKLIFFNSINTFEHFGYRTSHIIPLIYKEFSKHAYRILFSIYNQSNGYSKKKRVSLINNIEKTQYERIKKMFKYNGLKGNLISLLLSKNFIYFSDFLFKAILK
ncbi:glycosyltransferase family 2 protein [Paenimyroides viscosum]|uniref:Glycosyltransferase family 2 protein n=1 Tax=Paenimyroides viscosum TaxID=2488729 RepID=A0A3P1AN64_9FLAO|nr:glycosyltransferase family 2 protein [Paenimyroides viscosum]RRA90387.1 glycosyltransferase family 2 protein [Paenimyroides viscosum]